MGRNQNNKKLKKDTESEEEVSEDEELDEQQQDDLEEGDYDGELVDDIDGDEVLLKKIQDKIVQVDEEQKLSWAAIYQVKKEEASLNEEMQKEIDAVKEKYELKRLPLMNKISDAVSGKKLDKSLYTENEFVKSINLNKVKPKALKDYWGKVFDACGLISHEHDIDLLQKLISFRCDLIDAKIQNIKVVFEFQSNDFLQDKLEIEVSGSVQEGTFKKKVSFSAKKEGLDENSLFGMLTAKESDDQELLDTCHDLYRAYSSSTYFYFYEPADDLDDEEGDEGGDDEEGEQEDDESQNNVKAVNKPKGSAITEKPECKQQ